MSYNVPPPVAKRLRTFSHPPLTFVAMCKLDMGAEKTESAYMHRETGQGLDCLRGTVKGAH